MWSKSLSFVFVSLLFTHLTYLQRFSICNVYTVHLLAGIMQLVSDTSMVDGFHEPSAYWSLNSRYLFKAWIIFIVISQNDYLNMSSNGYFRTSKPDYLPNILFTKLTVEFYYSNIQKKEKN